MASVVGSVLARLLLTPESGRQMGRGDRGQALGDPGAQLAPVEQLGSSYRRGTSSPLLREPRANATKASS